MGKVKGGTIVGDILTEELMHWSRHMFLGTRWGGGACLPHHAPKFIPTPPPLTIHITQYQTRQGCLLQKGKPRGPGG